MSPCFVIIMIHSRGIFLCKINIGVDYFMKIGKILTTVPIGLWWAYDRLEKAYHKKKLKGNSDTLDNLEKLYALKKSGAISEDDYAELKDKLKEQI